MVTINNIPIYIDTRNKKLTSLARSQEYLLWLCDFTKNHHSWSNDLWDITNSGIKIQDQVNVHCLPFFFEYLHENAHKKGIMPEITKGNVPCIKYFFVIGKNTYSLEVVATDKPVFFIDMIREKNEKHTVIQM